MTEFYVEKVLRVDLTIRGPYPVRDDLIVIEITGGSLSGIGAYADKLSGMVKAPSGDALVVDASGAFKRDVRLLAQMDDESFLHMAFCSSSAMACTRASVILMHTDVQDLVAGSSAKKAIRS